MRTLYIWLLVSWKVLTGRISVEKLEVLMGSNVSTPKVTMLKMDEIVAVYPDWVESRLTPSLETGKSTGVKKYRLEYHPSQTAGKTINGHAIYAWLIETNQLPLCVELADLQWWAQHPNEIPEEFKGKLIYAWGSAVLNDHGNRCVPCLGCHGDKPYVSWYYLDYDWGGREPACLRAS
jgi:hypothetical protein